MHGELLSDARAATIAFRNERLNEPLDLYNRFFDEFATIFAELIDQFPDIADKPGQRERAFALVPRFMAWSAWP